MPAAKASVDTMALYELATRYANTPPAPDLTGAACVGEDPELFHPDALDHATRNQAKEICFGCPVRGACLEWSLSMTYDLAGIWGGLSQTERNEVKGARSRAGRTTERSVAA